MSQIEAIGRYCTQGLFQSMSAAVIDWGPPYVSNLKLPTQYSLSIYCSCRSLLLSLGASLLLGPQEDAQLSRTSVYVVHICGAVEWYNSSEMVGDTQPSIGRGKFVCN